MKQSKAKQQGAILVISMLILAVITIVSISGMRTSTTGEKMSANLRDRNTAFQSAEHGLATAEMRFTSATPGAAPIITSTAMFNGNNGMLGENDAEPNYTSVTWANANSQVAAGLDRIVK